MKKLFAILIISYGFIQVQAQYCGNNGQYPFGNPSDSSECVAASNTTNLVFSPNSDSLPPFVNDINSSAVITFKAGDTIRFGGQYLILTWLRIDTIGNIPWGLCWAINRTNNTFDTTGGCIKFNGKTCSMPGQYKIHMQFTTNVGVPILVDLDETSYKYYFRVKNQLDSNTPVDTSQTTANQFIPYGPARDCPSIFGGVPALNENFNSLTIGPNPFSKYASISFSSKISGKCVARINDLLGNEVYRKEIEANIGDNTAVIEAPNLSPGVYFYSLNIGKSSITKKIIIE